MLVIHQVVVGVQVLVGFRLPGAPLLGQILGHAVAQGAEAELLHVLQGGIARMVEHHVEQHADAAGMASLMRARRSFSLPMLASSWVKSSA